MVGAIVNPDMGNLNSCMATFHLCPEKETTAASSLGRQFVTQQ